MFDSSKKQKVFLYHKQSENGLTDEVVNNAEEQARKDASELRKDLIPSAHSAE